MECQDEAPPVWGPTDGSHCSGVRAGTGADGTFKCQASCGCYEASQLLSFHNSSCSQRPADGMQSQAGPGSGWELSCWCILIGHRARQQFAPRPAVACVTLGSPSAQQSWPLSPAAAQEQVEDAPHTWLALVCKRLLPDSKAAMLQAGHLGQHLRYREPISWEQASDSGVLPAAAVAITLSDCLIKSTLIDDDHILPITLCLVCGPSGDLLL